MTNRFTATTQQHTAQMLRAALDERDFYERLMVAGWVWHEKTQHWAHPDRPSVVVER